MNEERVSDNSSLSILGKLSYHYCSVETMCSIIKNKKLWLSSAKFMNDKYESIWIDNIVDEILIELESDASISKKNIKQFEDTYKTIKEKEHYLMCFSENGDLLSQWRGYGDDAKGVAIGFDIYEGMNKIGLTSKSQSVSDGKATSSKLGYESVSYNIKSTIKDLIKDTVIEDQYYKHNCVLIKELSSMAKHSYFEEENEVRITYTPKNYFQEEPNTDYDIIIKRLSKEFRVSDGNLIPYYELDFSTCKNSMIVPRIILGSKCKIDQEYLKEFLIDNKFLNTEIIKSDAPYK